MGPKRQGGNIQSFPPPSISCPWAGSKGKGNAKDVDNSLTEEPKRQDYTHHKVNKPEFNTLYIGTGGILHVQV